MKVIAVNGSPRVEGNTAQMLGEVLAVCEEAGFETELFQAGGRMVQGCLACGHCFTKQGDCATKDWILDLYKKFIEADVILLGSPTYFSDLTPEMKAVIDRCGYIAGNGKQLSRKIGAAISPVRRAGSIHTIDSMQHFFSINDMIIPGSTYWNMSIARAKDDYSKDTEGIATMRRLGENIVWLAKKLYEN